MKKVFVSIRFFAMPMYGATLAKAEIFLPTFLQISEMWSSKVNFLSHVTSNSFSVSPFFYFKPIYVHIYSVICRNQEMTFASITFQKVVFKSFKQTIGCLLKGCDKIIHVIGNHVWCIAISITGNIDVIYSKKQIY